MPHRPLLAAGLVATWSAAGLAQTPPQAPAGAAARAEAVLDARVLDLRGEPVPLARVQIADPYDPGQVLAVTVADGEGFVRVRVPSGAPWMVRVTADGHATCDTKVPEAHGAVLRVHDAATVRGVLRTRGGAPVAGAIVRACTLGRAVHADLSAATAAGGAFTIAGMPLGPTVVVAAVPGEGLCEARLTLAADAELALAPAQQQTTSLELVVDGLPPAACERAVIRLAPHGWYTHLPPPWQRPRLDAEGRCRLLELPMDDFTLQVHAPGFRFSPTSARLRNGDGPHRVHLVATVAQPPRASTTVHVTLRDDGGGPLQNLRLALRGAAPDALATTDAHGTATFATALGRGDRATVELLDPQRVFEQPPRAGRPWFAIGSAVKRELTLDPDATPTLRTLRACRVRGRVLSPERRAVPFATVELEYHREDLQPQWGLVQRAQCARDGSFELAAIHPLRAAVRVRAHSEAGALATAPFHLEDPGARVELPDLVLAPAAVVEGVVRGANERPLPGVRVWLRDWDFDGGHQRTGRIQETITDRMGRYRFPGVAPGGAWLQLLADHAEKQPRGRAVEPFLVEPGRVYPHDLEVPAR